MKELEYLKALSSSGHFPRELPYAFSTESFGQSVDEILEQWHQSGVFSRKVVMKRGRIKRGCVEYKISKNGYSIENISMPKRDHERRNISITHIIPQALLSYEIAFNYRSIAKFTVSKAIYSQDKPIISKQYSRGVSGINFSLHASKKRFIEATSDWLVATDVSRFYPSIYTHSIPWAAYGKNKVKENRDRYRWSLCDRLDTLVRACNLNQTIGIPVGPETSWILAEIVSSEVDVEVRARLDAWREQSGNSFILMNGDRQQDDWFFGATSFEQAEVVLSNIKAAYFQFGLEINGSKTDIHRTFHYDSEDWMSQISSFLKRDIHTLQADRLRAFLNFAVKIQKRNPHSKVTSYVISILETKKFGGQDVELIESYLVKAASISPIAMNKICQLIINIDRSTRKINRVRLRKRFNVLISRALENGNIYEVIWMLYTLRGLRVAVDVRDLQGHLKEHRGSIIPILLLDMKSKGLVVGHLPISFWESEVAKADLETSWIWLLAYEGIRNGWLSDTAGQAAKRFFEPMLAREVWFFDGNRNVRRVERVVRLRLRQLQSQRRQWARWLGRQDRFAEY